jgi:exodeoxyribonuclease VII small subunit
LANLIENKFNGNIDMITQNQQSNSYETALNELQEILGKIENQAISLDELTEQTKRARMLIEYCRNRLRQIETDTDQLLQI